MWVGLREGAAAASLGSKVTHVHFRGIFELSCMARKLWRLVVNMGGPRTASPFPYACGREPSFSVLPLPLALPPPPREGAAAAREEEEEGRERETRSDSG